MKPRPLPDLDALDIARFWSKISVGKQNECWEWQHSKFRGGYGQFKAKGRNLKAHRVAYFLYTGNDPGDDLTCHECDNPPCCNPLHLFPGAPLDNLQDAAKKGRTARLAGELHHSHTNPDTILRGERVGGSKLTLESVQEIRKSYALGNITQEQLGQRYGVTRRAIGQIIKGKNWKHAITDVEPASLSDPKRRARSGERNSSAKLSEPDVRSIRLQSDNGVPAKELANQYRVSVGTIYHILTRRSWAELD